MSYRKKVAARRAAGVGAILLAVLTGAGPATAQGSLPSVRIGTAPLLSPAQAEAFYGGGTASSAGIPGLAQPELDEIARALRGNPGLIHGYVRNTVETVWMHGLQKGAPGALIDRSGTAFDQAHLMVELLRRGGVQAGYEAGTITLTGQQFRDRSGVENAAAACRLLADGGIPAIVNGITLPDCAYGGAALDSVEMAHVWVTAQVGGRTVRFDPADKPFRYKAGADLPAVAGFAPAL